MSSEGRARHEDGPARGSATGAPSEMRTKNPTASMALIFDAIRNPIDPLYEDVARRREERGEPASKHRSLPLVVAVLAIGLLLGTTASALRVPKAVETDRRTQLIDQVETKQAANDRDALKVATLRDEVAAAQASALERADKPAVQKQLGAAANRAGTGAVTGSGLEMRLVDPTGSPQDADSDPRTGEQKDTITSRDLQNVVNGLWAAGATAITVNDQRLTSMSAIRFAGSAVLVNFRPLTTPYTIRAIGPDSLTGAFEGGDGGKYVTGMRRSGFRITTKPASDLTLPAVASVRIVHTTIQR